MKKSKAETAKTRQQIIEAASEAIRKRGIDATGVAEVMAAAGLSHGGFYRHFASKDELVNEAIAMSRKDFVAGTVAAADEGAGAILKHFQEYVTAAHRDDVGSGCPLAACGSEIVRADAKARHQATAGFWALIEKSAPFMRAPDGEDPTETAIGVVTNMIGALTMARMVDDPTLSDHILHVARNRIATAMGVARAKPRPSRQVKAA
jgi:TetR/AcrR family transcriptional regulator, transcriptional repressor for nem operon